MIHYIIKALQQAESIYVNDLGTFSLHYKSARIEGEKLLPPRNVVTLDTTTDQDDLSFTRLICHEKQCLLTEANREITQWVEELKNALANNKSVSFEDFGTFSQDSKGRLTFEAMDVPDLNIEFEGMPELSLNVSDVPSEIEDDMEEMKNEKEESVSVDTEEVTTDEETGKEEVTENITPEKESENEEITEVITTEKESEKEESESVDTEEVQTGEETEETEVTENIIPEKESEEEEITEVITTEEESAKEEDEPTDTEEVQTEEETEETEVTENIIPEKESENEEITEQITTEEESEKEESVKEEETEVEEDDEKDEEEDEEKPKKRRSLWWLYTLIVLLILAALGYIFRDKLQDIIRPIFDRFAHKEVEATKPEEIDTDTVSFTEVDTTAVADTAVVEEPYEPEVIKTSSAGYPYIHFEPGHYYAIAGSFLTEKEVLSHIRAKHLEEYSPKLVLQDGAPNIRICIGIYDTEEEAETFAKSINPKYWVLK
jgi:nucleoid DNA-binding protein